MTYAAIIKFIYHSYTNVNSITGSDSTLNFRSWAFGIADSAFYLSGSISLDEYDHLNKWIDVLSCSGDLLCT